jgi:hypothetical protein
MNKQPPSARDAHQTTPEGARPGADAQAAGKGWGNGADSALQHMKQLERAKAEGSRRGKHRPGS